MPSWAGVVLAFALLILLAWGLWRWAISRKVRAWKAVAQDLAGTLELVQGKMCVTGRYRGRAAFLSEAVSFEDAVAYAHTCGALEVTNPARAVLGLRRKSLLEEYTQRKEPVAIDTGDPEFGRTFLLVLTVPEHAGTLLSDEVRKRLKKFSDVEIYLRGTRLEWRRAGTVGSAREMITLFDIIADIADVLESLPPRTVSLSEALAEEALIKQGI